MDDLLVFIVLILLRAWKIYLLLTLLLMSWRGDFEGNRFDFFKSKGFLFVIIWHKKL